MSTSVVNVGHKVVSNAEWLEARKGLLAKEKEFTRMRDALNRQRLELPWERIEKNYVFDGLRGKETLADLFGDKSQLLIYHFMFGPGWEQGCQSCSLIADGIDGNLAHLAARDVAVAVVSRATSRRLRLSRSGWDGDSNGCRRMRMTSTGISMFRSRKKRRRRERCTTTMRFRRSRVRKGRG